MENANLFILNGKRQSFMGGRSGKLPTPRAVIAEGGCSEKDAKLAQKLGQLQPFIAVFPQECMGQLASFGPT